MFDNNYWCYWVTLSIKIIVTYFSVIINNFRKLFNLYWLLTGIYLTICNWIPRQIQILFPILKYRFANHPISIRFFTSIQVLRMESLNKIQDERSSVTLKYLLLNKMTVQIRVADHKVLKINLLVNDCHRNLNSHQFILLFEYVSHRAWTKSMVEILFQAEAMRLRPWIGSW